MGGFCEGVGRMFTPSDSDNSGMVDPGGTPPPAAPDTGALPGAPSIDAQAAQRRLARLSKYFTSPTGTLDTPTGSAGVF